MALRRIPGRAVVGRFGAGDSVHLASAVSTTNTVPSSLVRRQAYTPGGLSSLSSPRPHPYWRGGNLGRAWANEDDPDSRALFYTARDLSQTPDGRVYYDGDDDDAACGAFRFLQKLFKKKENPPGVVPPTELRRGSGGVKAKPLAPALGIHTRWRNHELAPGLQVRLREGTKVALANVGTADAPIWQITPGVRNPETGGFDGSGVLPLLALALKGGAAAASAKAARKMQAKAARGEPLDVVEPVSVAPGTTTQLGSVLVGALESGTCEDVQIGALLIDSDGREIEV